MSHVVLIGRVITQKLLRDWARIVILVVLAALGIVISVVLRVNTDAGPLAESGPPFLVWYGLSIFLPFGALLVSAEVFGDLRQEGTLVYLWLRPVRTSAAVGGAAGAALALVFGLIVVPLVVAGIIVEAPAIAGAASLGALAYTGLFLAFGLILSRPLLAGLLVLLVWENVIGSLGAATARLTVRSYTASLLTDGSVDVGTPVGRAFAASIAVPLAVGAAGLWLCAWRWRRAEVP